MRKDPKVSTNQQGTFLTSPVWAGLTGNDSPPLPLSRNGLASWEMLEIFLIDSVLCRGHFLLRWYTPLDITFKYQTVCVFFGRNCPPKSTSVDGKNATVASDSVSLGPEMSEVLSVAAAHSTPSASLYFLPPPPPSFLRQCRSHVRTGLGLCVLQLTTIMC